MVGDVELCERKLAVQRLVDFKGEGKSRVSRSNPSAGLREYRRGNPSSPALAPNTVYGETH
jgi:hypothetical protein